MSPSRRPNGRLYKPRVLVADEIRVQFVWPFSRSYIGGQHLFLTRPNGVT